MAEVTSPATKWVNEAPGSHDQRVSTDVFGTGIFGVGKFSEKDRTRTNWTRVIQALSSLFLVAGLSTMAAADIFTTNLQLRKPTVGVEDPVTSWGDKYNGNLDIHEAAICDKRVGCTIVGDVVVQGTVTTTGALIGDTTVFVNAPLLGDGSPGAALDVDKSSFTLLGPAIESSELPNPITVDLSVNANFDVGGSTLVVKDAKVGIGTASPGTVLDIRGAGTVNINGARSADFTAISGADTQLFVFNDDKDAAVFLRGAADTVGSSLNLWKSRATDGSADTIVLDGDDIGAILARGADGANFRTAAQILFEVDGTPGSSDMPGRISFFTTPDGSATMSERMRINNAGNVGIGTMNPSTLLNLFSILPTLHLEDAEGTVNEPHTFGRINFVSSDGTGGNNGVGARIDGIAQTVGDWNSIDQGRISLGFFVGRPGITLTEAMRIDGRTGNVGVGTTSPDAKFEVVSAAGGDTMRVTATATNTPGIIFQNVTTGLLGQINVDNAGDVVINSRVGGVTQLLMLKNSGDVGIGTASPTDTLDVDGTVLFSTSTNTDSDAMTIAAGVTTFNDDGKLRDFLIKDGNGASAFFMQSTNGDIGIGTASPTESIHTTGGIKFTGAVSMTNPLVNAAYADYASNNMRLLCSGPDATTRCGFRILTRESDLGNTITAFEIQADGEVVIAQDGGNVGIGTATPDALLDVEGSAAFGSGATKSTFTTTGHLNVSGTAPVTSACGTSPAVSGTDMAGKATIGTTVTTSCTLTFATAYTNAPACTIAGDNTAVTYAATTTTTVLTITSSADMDSDVISYICIGI